MTNADNTIPGTRTEAALMLSKLFERQVELEQLAMTGMLTGKEADSEKEYAQLKAAIESTLRLIETLPAENPSVHNAAVVPDPTAKAASLELEQLKKRREELEYMAHAHGVEGQALPSDVEEEYLNLQASIRKIEAYLAQKK